MSQTFDANILVYASNELDPQTARARRLLLRLASGPELVVLFWPVVMAYLRIATHPSIFPHPLTPTIAEKNIESLLARPHVRAAGELSDHWSAYRRVSAELPVRGNLVPDAHLVALMHQHGVGTVWSRDRDLRKFANVTVKDPFDEAV